MVMNPKQIAAVFALPPVERFEHFVKVVADRQKAWGLYQDGWAMAGTAEGDMVFPLWPQREYAEACALDAWAGYTATEIPLHDLMHVLLPRLRTDGVLPGVLPTPSSKGTTPSVDELIAALEEELKRY
ncbi:DUF2750 domain-containing protein [Massilia sp. YMA4]|nr:DUF2750 domain-containing protein [Massilia sp. YMA4]